MGIPSCRALFADHQLYVQKNRERPETFLKLHKTEHKNTFLPIFEFKAVLKILVGMSTFSLPTGNIRLDELFRMSFLPKNKTRKIKSLDEKTNMQKLAINDHPKYSFFPEISGWWHHLNAQIVWVCSMESLWAY